MSWQLYFNRAFSLIEFTDFIPATLKTMVFGFIIGTIALLSRVHDDAGHRGRRPRVDAQRRAVVDPDHRGQRRARAVDLLPVPASA